MKKLLGYALAAMMVVSFGIGCGGSATTAPKKEPEKEKKEPEKEKK